MTEKGYFGLRGVSSSSGQYNADQFQIDQALRSVRTSIPVEVVSVIGGGAGSLPTVDVRPLINQIDGVGNQTPHGIIHGIPAIRMHGGGNAIICDPAAGDVGVIIVSDRDISSFKASGGSQANPGSRRFHSMADGIYIGSIVTGASDQAVQFTATGVKIFDKNGNIIEMAAGAITVTGNLHVTGQVIAGYGGADQVGLQTHTHSQAPDSGGNTEADVSAPIAGT